MKARAAIVAALTYSGLFIGSCSTCFIVLPTSVTHQSNVLFTEVLVNNRDQITFFLGISSFVSICIFSG